eukprot:TRINITY_DN3626_c0_g1_i10.p2 TRINITY_DN3626_c0_g1~~TRINITY_DN3626_c0_g1_i10.p2  ORF type:complete len:130 (-),score=11.77 TRINITY_DN3626_c0_g1_i10:431-820(-)
MCFLNVLNIVELSVSSKIQQEVKKFLLNIISLRGFLKKLLIEASCVLNVSQQKRSKLPQSVCAGDGLQFFFFFFWRKLKFEKKVCVFVSRIGKKSRSQNLGISVIANVEMFRNFFIFCLSGTNGYQIKQ